MNPNSGRTALAVFLFGAMSVGADEQKPVVSIPMRLNDAYQYSIQARINGLDAMWCHVDSGGGDRIYLDRDWAAKAGIKPTSTGLSAGPQNTKMTQDDRSQVTVEVSSIKLVNQTALLQSMSYMPCVIGQTVFQQYVVEVDYETPAIRLYDPAQFHYNGPGQTLPLTMEGGNPFVTATLTTTNGKSFQARVAVDTGGGSAVVMMSKSYVDKSDLMSQIQDPVSEPTYGYSGRQARVIAARIEKLTVGPFEISRPVIHLWQIQGFGGSSGPDGLLCSAFLRRFKLFFDYGRKTITL